MTTMEYIETRPIMRQYTGGYNKSSHKSTYRSVI